MPATKSARKGKRTSAKSQKSSKSRSVTKSKEPKLKPPAVDPLDRTPPRRELAKGKVASLIMLNNTYGRSSVTVLESAGFISQLPRKRGGVRKYRVLTDAPSLSVAREMRNSYYTVKAPDAIAEASSEIETIIDELQSWHDNLPESLQGGSKGEELETAVQELESARDQYDLNDDLPDFMAEIKFVHIPGNVSSRSERISDAASLLDSAADAIYQFADELDFRIDKANSGETTKDVAAISEQVNQCREIGDGIRTVGDQLSNVSIPGMY